MQFFKKNWALILIIILGLLLRFYKLDWGDGLFTHPDEYHIVAAVNQLSFPNQLNPHFFNYGTVTIYLIYFTKLLILNIFQTDINVFLLGRFISALFSTLSLIFVYKISSKFLTFKFSLLTLFLAATLPGLIQQAHFATPESALIFFMLGTIYFLKNPILAGVFLGLSLGVKVSSIILLLPILTALGFKYFHRPLKLLTFSIITLTSALITLLVVAPFIWLDFSTFYSSLIYEGGLATGSQKIFYTRQFIDTQPVIFQMTKIYPYALGPSLLISSLIGLVIFIYFSVKEKSVDKVIFLISFFVIFFANAFLFTKWTRFIAPTFPLLIIFSGYLFFKLSKIKLPRWLFVSCLMSLVLLHLIWFITFFHIYQNPDVRTRASDWMVKNMSPNSKILVEGGNMVDLPLSGNYQRTSLDFYTLEENPNLIDQLIANLSSSDYFIIQSRRVFMNHQRLPQFYPKLANFYDRLFNNSLGYTFVREFNSYPKFIIYNLEFIIPDEVGEETWSVFDHPVIRIYKNTHKLSILDYEKLLKK